MQKNEIKKKGPIEIHPCFLPRFYLPAALRCAVVQPSKGSYLEKPVTLKQKNWWGILAAHAHTDSPSPQCIYCCLHVYGHAYSLLLAFLSSISPLLSLPLL